MVNHAGYNINDAKPLTLDILIKYVKNINFDKCLNEDSNIMDRIGDGYHAHYFLKDLEKKFNVSFKKFDFKKYFHYDHELRNNGCLFFWKKKETRQVEPLTTKELYEYMVNHQKPRE